MRVEILTGPSAPSFTVQVKKTKLKYDSDTLKLLEKLRQSVLYLSLNDIITDKITQRSMDKVVRKLISHLCRKNKLKSAIKPLNRLT